MSDVVNLRQFRKQKKRDEKAANSKIKRAEFGQSKTEKTVVDLTRERHNKHLDDHKRDKGSD